MGISRRQFTKEFKEAAVRRLELGASVGEVARACEVTRTCCTAGSGNCMTTGLKRSRAMAGHGQKKSAWLRWSVRWAAKRWRSIFCKDACSMSRSMLVASQDGRFTVFEWSACEHMVHAHRLDVLLL